MKKRRLDEIMAGRDLAESPEKAAALVMAGLVFSGEQRLEKPGQILPEDLPLSVRAKEHPYVSRGGLKLEAALKTWQISVKGLVCLDLGSSTGGFTDCLLQAGASQVVAVDVGTNQLDWRLRQDPRVRLFEQTNARSLTPEFLGRRFPFVSADLSFISLRKIYPVIVELLEPRGRFVALLKPQFEAERDEVPEGGVIADASLRERILGRLLAAAEEAELEILARMESPLRGREGNLEFLIEGRKKN